MNWVKRFSRSIEPLLIVFSNRPPFEQSGGALQVINATKPDVWVGPADPITDEAFVDAKAPLATTTHTHNKDGKPFPYDIVTVDTPEGLQHHQYNTISNSLLWPVAHSMKPNTGDMTIQEIEKAYFDGYLDFNQLGQHALEKTAKDRGFDASKGDRIWVHDYQCDNVPGQIYSRHIPWPSLDWLASDEVTFPIAREDGNGLEPHRINILDTDFFRDLMENASNRTLSTFQRPVDQVNFLMTAAYMQSRMMQPLTIVEPESLNAVLADMHNPAKWDDIKQHLLNEITMGKMITIEMFGERTSLMNMPVGQNQEETLVKAKNEHYTFAQDKLKPSIFSVSTGNGQTVNPTHLDPAQYPDGVDLETFLDGLNTSKWVLSVHRNDYTKGTDTKLEAAERILKANKEKGIEDTTFLFVLQPTREDVPGYKEYAEDVYKKVAELKAEYGPQSVVVIPQGISHDAIVKLARKDEIRGFMGLGHKDGHDLTVREVVDANSDRTRPLGVITSDGIGASDVLAQDEQGNKGSFVIKDPKSVDEVSTVLSTILDDANDHELKARFDVMKERSKTYSAKHFGDKVKEAYATAHALKMQQSVTPQGRRGDIAGESPNASIVQKMQNKLFPQWNRNSRRATYMQNVFDKVRSGMSDGQSR